VRVRGETTAFESARVVDIAAGGVNVRAADQRRRHLGKALQRLVEQRLRGVEIAVSYAGAVDA
jgi:hypothetical protein